MPRRRVIPETRRFGLELEFAMNGSSAFFEALRGMAEAFHIPYRQQLTYHRTRGVSWDLKLDGSCGYELASPPLRWDSWWQVAPLCECIYTNGGTITRSCGVHVHHEVRDAAGNTMLRRLYLLWYALEPLAFATVHSSRWENVYCARVNRGMYPGRLDALMRLQGNRQIRAQAQGHGRHSALNFLSYWRNGTVEFRIHHGSLDPTVLEWWVTFTQTIVQLSSRAIRDSTLRTLLMEDPTTLPERFVHLVRRMRMNSDRVNRMLQELPHKVNTNTAVMPRYKAIKEELTRVHHGSSFAQI